VVRVGCHSELTPSGAGTGPGLSVSTAIDRSPPHRTSGSTAVAELTPESSSVDAANIPREGAARLRPARLGERPPATPTADALSQPVGINNPDSRLLGVKNPHSRLA